MPYNNLDTVLNAIENALINHDPFSIIRLGDGDLRILIELSTKNFTSRRSRREGYTIEQADIVLKMYVRACNTANFISSFDPFLNGTFWRDATKKQIISTDCVDPVLNWKGVYKLVGIKNENFCCPELGWQLFLSHRRNLFDLIKGRKVCLVNCWPNAKERLTNLGYDCDMVIIPRQFHGGFNYINRIKKELKAKMSKADLFLVGAGAVGRGYSSFIKKNGGIAIDIGKTFNMWIGKRWNEVYSNYVVPNRETLMFELTDKGRLFEPFF